MLMILAKFSFVPCSVCQNQNPVQDQDMPELYFIHPLRKNTIGTVKSLLITIEMSVVFNSYEYSFRDANSVFP